MMESGIYTMVAFGIVLGVVVLIHELGHYFAARLMGVKVEVFSIGFGRRILGTQIGDTDFRLSLIPLGGYVKMSGEDAEDDTQYNSWDFQAKNRAQKIFILASGAIMNLLLATLIFTGIFMAGVKENQYSMQEPFLGYVLKDSPADKAGLKVGDLIDKIDGKKIKDWKELEFSIATRPEETLKIEFFRNKVAMQTDLTVEVRGKEHVGYAGISYKVEAIIGGLLEGGAAEKYGLKEGDKLLAVNGDKIAGYYTMRNTIISNPGSKMSFLIDREGKEITVDVVVGKDKNGKGALGIYPHIPLAVKSYPLGTALKMSLKDMKRYSVLVLTSFRKMIVGKLSPKNLSGPLEIADYSGKAMKAGTIPFVYFIAFISLQLGIVNLFPVPALDGGHLMIYTLEAIIRREFSVKVKTVLINMGFLILLSLMGFVILNDVAKKMPNGWASFWPF